jgi:hypothetical protein
MLSAVKHAESSAKFVALRSRRCTGCGEAPNREFVNRFKNPCKIKLNKKGGTYNTYGKKRNVVLLLALVRKSEVRRPLGRSKHWWKDIIKIRSKETGLG